MYCYKFVLGLILSVCLSCSSEESSVKPDESVLFRLRFAVDESGDLLTSKVSGLHLNSWVILADSTSYKWTGGAFFEYKNPTVDRVRIETSCKWNNKEAQAVFEAPESAIVLHRLIPEDLLLGLVEQASCYSKVTAWKGDSSLSESFDYSLSLLNVDGKSGSLKNINQMKSDFSNKAEPGEFLCLARENGQVTLTTSESDINNVIYQSCRFRSRTFMSSLYVSIQDLIDIEVGTVWTDRGYFYLSNKSRHIANLYVRNKAPIALQVFLTSENFSHMQFYFGLQDSRSQAIKRIINSLLSVNPQTLVLESGGRVEIPLHIPPQPSCYTQYEIPMITLVQDLWVQDLRLGHLSQAEPEIFPLQRLYQSFRFPNLAFGSRIGGSVVKVRGSQCLIESQ